MNGQYQTNENRRARAKRSGLGLGSATTEIASGSSDQGSSNALHQYYHTSVNPTPQSSVALRMTGAAAIVALTAHDLRHLAATVPAGDRRHRGYAELAEQSAGFLAWLSEQLAALETTESTEARP